MAKRCEICDKGPVVGRTVSHAHNVGPRRFEVEPADRARGRERRHQAHARLHALHPLEEDRQGRLTPMRPRGDSRAGGAPAIGPYSPALRVGQLLFLSGQIPLTGRRHRRRGRHPRADHAGAREHARRCSTAAAPISRSVVKTTIYLADMGDFAVVNEIYATYFAEPYPARATVQVARLPRDVRVEIDAIAVLD